MSCFAMYGLARQHSESLTHPATHCPVMAKGRIYTTWLVPGVPKKGLGKLGLAKLWSMKNLRFSVMGNFIFAKGSLQKKTENIMNLN